MRRYVPKFRLFYEGSEAMQAALAEAFQLIDSRAGQATPAAAPAQQPSRLPPGAAAVAAAAAAAAKERAAAAAQPRDAPPL